MVCHRAALRARGAALRRTQQGAVCVCTEGFRRADPANPDQLPPIRRPRARRLTARARARDTTAWMARHAGSLPGGPRAHPRRWPLLGRSSVGQCRAGNAAAAASLLRRHARARARAHARAPVHLRRPVASLGVSLRSGRPPTTARLGLVSSLLRAEQRLSEAAMAEAAGQMAQPIVVSEFINLRACDSSAERAATHAAAPARSQLGNQPPVHQLHQARQGCSTAEQALVAGLSQSAVA